MSLQEQIQNEIQNTVPQMIEDSITTHTHNGGDSQNIQGQNIVGAPQNPLTTATGGSLTSGGTAVLSNSDSTILSNAITRIADVESRLRTLGLLN